MKLKMLAIAAAVTMSLPAWADKTYNADVVVVGAGAGGTVAAVSAVEGGLKTIMIEKNAFPGGAGLFMEGSFGVQTPYTKAKGMKWTTTDAFNAMASYHHWRINAPLMKAFVELSGDTIQWVEDHGVKWKEVKTAWRDKAEQTWHIYPYAGSLPKTMVELFKKEGGTLLLNTPGEKLITKDGKVTGVIAKDTKTGEKVTINAENVILATGGITGTPESLDFWVPSVAGKGVSIGCSANDGTAMRIAVRDVGVPLSHMQYIASYPCGIVVNGRNGPYCRFWYFTNAGGILINKNGKRFVTEQEGICHITPHLAMNPEGWHIVFMDKRIYDETRKHYKVGALIGLPAWNDERVEEEFKLGKNLFRANSIADFCKLSGVDEKGLREQIKTWNEAVAKKSDLQFGRTNFTQPIDEKGPFYGIKMFPWNNLSCGGFRVTDRLEVLGWDLKPVKGLYAAGETVAGVHGAFYCGGNACGFAHTSGYMAGQIAMGRKDV